MAQLTKQTLQFFKELKANNNREWFNDNKSRYEEAKSEFEIFVDALIREISKFDSSIAHHAARDCIFRIYRDVRFSKDKSPYKTHLGAHVTAAAKRSEIHSRAGYYIHIEPGGNSMLAGGAYLPKGSWLKAIRQEIHYHSDDLKKILNHKDFKQYFGEIEGEKLKTTPKEYPADHPDIELLKYKSFLASHPCEDKKVLESNFLEHGVKVFRALYPFDSFLNRAGE